jgi:hypothetical protein
MTYDAFSLHEVNPTLDYSFVEFHAAQGPSDVNNCCRSVGSSLGDAIHQQTTHSVIAIVNGNQMASFVQLIGGS